MRLWRNKLYLFLPASAGQPANYAETGAPTGNTQNGYEDPTTWFSNVSADTSRGQVNLFASTSTWAVDLLQSRGTADFDHHWGGLLTDPWRGFSAQGGHQHRLILRNRQP